MAGGAASGMAAGNKCLTKVVATAGCAPAASEMI